MQTGRILLVVLCLASADELWGQAWDRMGNPPVKVTLKHPLGSPIRFGTVAFGEITGQCSDQITGALTEARELLFFDDGDYNLKTAYNLFKAGQIEQALDISRTNFEKCRADPKHKPKHLRHAMHNVAMCLFAMDKHEEALPLFQEALTYEGGDVQTEAIAECQKAIALTKEMQQFEEKLAIGATPAAAGAASGAPAATPPGGSTGAEERLKKFNDLYKKGLLTKQEYEAKKAEILKDL